MDLVSSTFAASTPLIQTSIAEIESLPAGSEQQRIDNVATEFESVFVSLLLKEMRNTLDSKDGGLFGSEGSDTFGGMFDMFMGQHMAQAQSLGIADAVEGYLKNMPTQQSKSTE